MSRENGKGHIEKGMALYHLFFAYTPPAFEDNGRKTTSEQSLIRFKMRSFPRTGL